MHFKFTRLTRWKFIFSVSLILFLETIINFDEYFIGYEDVVCERGFYDSGREAGEPFRNRGKATGTRFYLIDSERYLVGQYMHHAENNRLHRYENGSLEDNDSVNFICFASRRSYIPLMNQDFIISNGGSPVDVNYFNSKYKDSLKKLDFLAYTIIFNNFFYVFLMGFFFPKE